MVWKGFATHCSRAQEKIICCSIYSLVYFIVTFRKYDFSCPYRVHEPNQRFSPTGMAAGMCR